MIKKTLSLLFLSFLFSASAISATNNTINVAVAANFKATLQALQPAFEKQSGHRMNIISSGTGHLSHQILNGAPFDIFLAANTQHPKMVFEKLNSKRKLSSHALQAYAHGRLALYISKDTPSHNLTTMLSGDVFSKLALANKKLAPYGLAAEQTLQHLKLTKKWQGKLIRGQNVAQVFQFVHTKNVDAGFVAYSMVKTLDPALFIEVPLHFHHPIEQMALRLNHKETSLDFMTFLSSPHAQNIISQQGYDLPIATAPSNSSRALH